MHVMLKQTAGHVLCNFTCSTDDTGTGLHQVTSVIQRNLSDEVTDG